jgi:hypothetical protein
MLGIKDELFIVRAVDRYIEICEIKKDKKIETGEDDIA